LYQTLKVCEPLGSSYCIIHLVELNQPAPDFELPDLAGTVHRLRDYLGRTVILNFWSAECPACARVDADLLAGLPGWGGRVTLLTVAANAGEPDAALAAAARARALPVVLRGRPEVRGAYEAQTTPHLFVVDASGILRYRGAFDDVTFRQRTPTKFYLRDAVSAVLENRLPDPAETAPFGCAIVRFVLE
jgi:thiol-disulfide isomerase/thioredoxin